jgi:chitodextrinase
MTAIPRYVSTAPEAAARIAGFVFGDGNPEHTDNPLGPAIAFTALNTTAWTQTEIVRCAGILGWHAGTEYRIPANGNVVIKRDSLYAALGITDSAHDLYHRALEPKSGFTPTRVQVEAFAASIIETEGSFSTNPPKWFDEARGGTYTQRVDGLTNTLNSQSLGAFVSGVAVKVPLAATDAFPMPLISAARYPGDTPADWPDGAPPPPDETPPSVPVGLAAVPGVQSVALTWTVNSEPDLAGYILYRDGNTEIYIGSVQSFLDTGLVGGTEYSYQVASFDTSENSSALSSPVFATPTTGTSSDTTPPDAPSLLTATPTSTTVFLSWIAPAATDVTKYFVYKGVIKIATVTIPTTSYTATGLSPSTAYSFAVTAVDAAGNQSNAAAVTTSTLFGSVDPPLITQERIDIVSSIGCASEYDVYVMDRSGTIALRQLPFTGLSWNRRMDDVSTATISLDLANGSDPEGCCTAVQGLYRYAYEIGIYRDTFLVWQGPVVEVTASGENIEIRAEDKMTWLKVRPIWSYLNYPDPGEDCSIIFNDVINNAMLPDNVPGLTGTATPTGIRAAREYLTNPPQVAFDAIQELARTGVDYTMIKDTLVAGSFVVPASPIAFFTDQALAALPNNEWLGTNFATQIFVTGDPEQDLVGTYGGIDPLAGLVVRIYQEDDIKDQTSLNQNAKSRWELMSTGQLLSSSQITLDPAAPLPIDLAVPGAVIDLRLTETCFPIFGRFRLLEMEVTVSGASDGVQETVNVTIEPVGTEIVT